MGDKNTSFFHKFVTYSRKKNIVKSLVRSNGSHVKGDKALLNLVTEYFKDLFNAKLVRN